MLFVGWRGVGGGAGHRWIGGLVLTGSDRFPRVAVSGLTCRQLHL